MKIVEPPRILKNQSLHVRLARPVDIPDLSDLDNLVWRDKCPEPTGIIQFWNNQERHNQKTPWLGTSQKTTPPFCSFVGSLLPNAFTTRNEAAWAKIMKHGFLLTAWKHGVLAGSVAVVLFRYGGDVHGRVHKVTVRPEHRVSGIGTALMTAAVRLADQHFLSLSVSVNQDNPAAIQLYKKAGFLILNDNENDLSQHTKWLSESGIEFSSYDKKLQLVRMNGPVKSTPKIEGIFDVVR